MKKRGSSLKNSFFPKNHRKSPSENSFFPKNHRGISPVIATVLLIAMVIVIGLIVFLWFRGILVEGITKFGKNVELVCEEVGFEESYSGGTLSILNTMPTPIYRMKIKIFKAGGWETKDLKDLCPESWPDLGLNQGGAFSGDVSSDIGDAEKIILIPVLMGSSEKGKKSHICEERHGHEIII